MRKCLVLWLASLVVVAGLASALTFAQAPGSPGQQFQPRIVSGNDFGFRVEGIDPTTRRPIGVLVLRVDGEWVEVAFGPAVRRLN